MKNRLINVNPCDDKENMEFSIYKINNTLAKSYQDLMVWHVLYLALFHLTSSPSLLLKEMDDQSGSLMGTIPCLLT
jgi:hypothetical protein